jgi:chitodextrinase
MQAEPRMNLRSKTVVAAAVLSVVAASAVSSVVNATPARAAGITYIQGAAFSTGTQIASLPVALSSAIGSGDLLVGWFSEYNAAGQVTVSDSVNGPWTRGPSALSFGSGGDIALYYLANSKAASGGLTITVGASAATYLQGAVAEYSGVALSAPLDHMAVASGLGTAVDSGATAAAAAGDLVFGALVTGTSPTGVTPGSSNGVAYTTRASTSSGSAYAEDITSATAGAQHGTATLTVSADWYAVAAAFFPVPVGAVAPAAPTAVTATSVTSSNVTLSWTKSTDNAPVTGYTVFRNGVQIGTTATTGYNDATVAPSTTYSYTVTASNDAAQTSPPSSALPVTTPATPPPSIAFVQGNTVSTGTQVASTTMQLTHPVGAGDLLVGWFSLYNGATGTLQVSDNQNGAWMRGPSSLAFQNDTGDIALYYKENSKAASSGVTITVASASGTGYLTGVVAEYSDVALAGALDQMTTARAISTSIDTGLTGPAATTELVYSAALIDTPSGTQTITPGSSQGVTFTPRAQTSNISAYEQDITAPASGPQHGPAALGVSADWYAATVVFRQLPAGTTQAPTAPTGLTAPSIASTRVALSWSAASDASTPVTGYTVYRGSASIGITASSGLTFIDVSTAASTTYSYTVDAFNGTGQHSAHSAALSVTTPAHSPEFIQGAAISVGARQTSLQITLPKPVLAGDLLMGWYGQYNVPGQVQVSDNVNGAWVRSSATEAFNGSGDIALEYVQNSLAAPSGITITVSVPPGASAYLQEVIAQFRGVSTTNALDQVAVAESNTGTAIRAGPTAAVAAGDLVVGAVITGGQPGNIIAGSSDSVPYINDVVDAQNGSASADLEDILSSTAGTQSANATLGVGGDWYMVVATFRPAPTTFTLSGIVKTSGGTPLNGSAVHVFDGTSYIYDGAATMGSGGTYSITLPPGTYKLYVQPNTPGYADQWVGGSSYASATVVTVSAATSQDITLVGTTLFTLSGVVRGSGGTPHNGTAVYAFDGTSYIYDGAATMGHSGTYTSTLPAGTYKLYVQPNTAGYADQWLGGSDYSSATAITVSAATTQDITLTP